MHVILTAEGSVSEGGAAGRGRGEASLCLGRESRLDLPPGESSAVLHQGTGAQGR